jgi:glycosyltransferase involved in cell wall biosynthesis
MSSPTVSIVTPTKNREKFLPFCYGWACAQKFADWEWLVEDDSAEPSPFLSKLSDPRVHYRHDPVPKSVGVKRNNLVERAKGSLIAHFDDDDYYAPDYLLSMINTMRDRNADFIKLSAFYLYSSMNGVFAYWDLHAIEGLHFDWEGGDIHPLYLNKENNARFAENYLAYGFSYVFKRDLWGPAKYPDVSGPEDSQFLKAAYRGRSLLCLQDQLGMCLHVLQGDNLSRAYPQFFLPQFLLPRIFPGAIEYLKAISTIQDTPAKTS